MEITDKLIQPEINKVETRKDQIRKILSLHYRKTPRKYKKELDFRTPAIASNSRNFDVS